MIALGSRGDVQPLVTLGHRLRAAGHDVCVATEQAYESLVRRYGLEYSEVHGNVRQSMQNPLVQAMVDGRRIVPMARIAWARRDRRVQAGVRQRLVDVWRAAQNADALMGATFGLHAGYSVAEKLRRPLIRVFYSPPDIPYTRGFRSRPRWDRFLVRICNHASWTAFRSAMNLARQEVLDLRPLPYFNPTAAVDQKRWPALCAFSPHVCPPPVARDRPYHVTGYWFLPNDPACKPSRELLDFLAAGPPPVYVGFGSMVHRSPEATTALIVDALARAGQRGILATGWGGLNHSTVRADHVHVVDDAPHDWLFTQVAAAVHHGGAGTVASVLRAGRPSVVMPFGIPEQPFWGERIAQLGVGPPPINRKRLSVDGLARSIRAMVEDTDMQRRAAALGESLRREDGVGRAVEVVETSVREFAWEKVH